MPNDAIVPATAPPPVSTSTTVAPGPNPPPVGAGSLNANAVCASLGTDNGMARPANAVAITTGDNPAAIAEQYPAGTVYWLTPGEHVLSTPVRTQAGDQFLGAPGAVLSGNYLQPTAFTGAAYGVTLRGFTIEKFGTAQGWGNVNNAAVNRNAADGWIVDRMIIRLNDGAGLFVGSHSQTTASCFDRNGQYGLAAALRRDANGRPLSVIAPNIEGNEIVGNNRSLVQSSGACSGCAGAMKLWQTTSAVVASNWIHHNRGPGVWADNNNVDTLVEHNVVENNEDEGIFIETSYNVRVLNNRVSRNTWVQGQARAASDSFPDAGIFISNSGGSALVPGAPKVEVAGNLIENNFNALTVFQDANRFCTSVTDSSRGHCTLTGGTTASCPDALVQGTDAATFMSLCHWMALGVHVHHNQFVNSAGTMQSCGVRCGRVSIVATTEATTVSARVGSATVTAANPVAPGTIRARISDPSVQQFIGNSYDGAWRFTIGSSSQSIGFAEWRSVGFDR